MVSQLPRPATKTVSRCTPQTARGTHTFEIAGYSLQKGLGAGKFIRSGTFAIGGYDWCLRYYPDGDSTEEDYRDYLAVYLELQSKNAEVRVQHDLRLIDRTTESSLQIFCSKEPWLFSTVDFRKNSYAWGTPKFKKRSDLENSRYLRDDCLVIECDVTVIKQPIVVETVETDWLTAPSPNISQDLAKLLESKERADVTFKVEGETFAAHAFVLAMRSPVFKAQFYGPLKEQEGNHITIQDVQPEVFRALLHFIYTDCMFPGMEDLDRDDKKKLIQHLLVAADRYDVRGLKQVCEKALCESLDVETVAAMLALADQHNCSKLKTACIEFMICPDRWDGVAASEGYNLLKRSSPASILADVLEKAVKSPRI